MPNRLNKDKSSDSKRHHSTVNENKKCFKCGEKGHIKSECQNAKNVNEVKREQWPQEQRIGEAAKLPKGVSWTETERKHAKECVRLCEIMVSSQIELHKIKHALALYRPKKVSQDVWLRTTGERRTIVLPDVETEKMRLEMKGWTHKADYEAAETTFKDQASLKLLEEVYDNALVNQWSFNGPQGDTDAAKHAREITLRAKATFEDSHQNEKKCENITIWLNLLANEVPVIVKEEIRKLNALHLEKLARLSAKEAQDQLDAQDAASKKPPPTKVSWADVVRNDTQVHNVSSRTTRDGPTEEELNAAKRLRREETIKLNRSALNFQFEFSVNS